MLMRKLKIFVLLVFEDYKKSDLIYVIFALIL